MPRHLFNTEMLNKPSDRANDDNDDDGSNVAIAMPLGAPNDDDSDEGDEDD